MISISDLQKIEDVVELKEIAAKLDIAIHHRAGKDRIIEAIAEKLVEPNKPTVNRQVLALQPVHNTPDMVLERLQPYLAKDGFMAVFDELENTWEFSYKGARESGNLDIPLKIILQKAQNISLGARRLRAAGPTDGFESNVGKGYAANVLL